MIAPTGFEASRRAGLEPATIGLEIRCPKPVSEGATTSYDDADPTLTDLLTELDRESPGLARVVRAWPALPPELKAAVVAIIETAARNQSATECR